MITLELSTIHIGIMTVAVSFNLCLGTTATAGDGNKVSLGSSVVVVFSSDMSSRETGWQTKPHRPPDRQLMSSLQGFVDSVFDWLI